MTIYVIEDDEAVRDSIRMLLEVKGFAVVDFASGEKFLEAKHPSTRSCFLLDINLPGRSGLELLVQIRLEKPYIPAILMTGRSSSELRRAAMVADVLLPEKPFRPGELVSSIERSLSIE